MKKKEITNKAIFDMAVAESLAENSKKNGMVNDYRKFVRKAKNITDSIKTDELEVFMTTVKKLKETDKFKEYCERYVF